MSILKRLLGKKVSVGGYLVIDLTENTIKLPSGKRIPINRILRVDNEKGTIIYIDTDGTIVEEPYRIPEQTIKNMINAIKNEKINNQIYA
jgi:hypothetical protein